MARFLDADPARGVLAGGLDPNAGRLCVLLLPNESHGGAIGCDGGLELLAGQAGDRDAVQFAKRRWSAWAKQQHGAHPQKHDQAAQRPQNQDRAAGWRRGLRFARGFQRHLAGLLQERNGP